MAPGVAEVAHQFGEPQQPAEILVLVVLAELDEQDRFGIAAHHGVDRRLEHGDVAREPEHGAVDQLDRDRPELDDVLRRLHRTLEAAEVAGADRAAAEQRRELQLDLGGKAERAFRADQDVREVDVVAAGHERIEIVAADPALHLREAHLDLSASRAPIAMRSRASGLSAAGTSERSGATGPKCAALPSGSSASIESTFSRVLP